ncbi:hypothetical protein TVAG_003910 [Trichomonas vaginalis G3]|uniref:Uncharacterized protein n=1 Tax=Trichomonas vaginalis (strain ATCC PRA-98 / G3) TaxID=412133 RepID=A2E5A5_TRIV3|nr:armadillo (ARM) repeat-containing protein family [Trichomonas vaginalis G3]EAY12185.1 hypothetical protein TVAG_003910 [Trichomonas vaginalis G3]KAI5515428.1 armadillo (ARM) repeat-containing protein family [Trichomonas vaginalis G3]|eukprot:XP_001324408.1 hypothetical protein [Trichomonas vaginalis G3]
MVEPIHNPDASEIENLNKLFLETGKNPEANQELNRIASEDQIQFFYSTAIIISSLPIPLNEEDANTDAYNLFRNAITLITRCLRPYIRSSRDIVQEYLNRVPPEIHINLCQLFSNILDSPFDDIRSPASIITSQLIRIDFAGSKNKSKSEFLESLEKGYDSFGNDFKKVGVLEAFTLCNEEDIVSTRTRIYRNFCKNQFARGFLTFTSDIPQRYRSIGLRALNIFFQKVSSRIIDQKVELQCLDSLLQEFSTPAETIEYYTLLCSTTKLVICDLLPQLVAGDFETIFKTINFECPDEESLPLLASRIQIWRSIIKTQNRIINNLRNEGKDYSELPFFQVAPQLCDMLLQVICQGDYSQSTDVETYVASYEALRALKVLGEMIPQYLVERSGIIYQEIVSEHPDQIVVSMCIWQVMIQIKEVDGSEIMGLMEQVFEICVNNNADANTKIACLNVIQSFIQCRMNDQNDDGNQIERIEQILQIFDILFQSGNSQLFSRIFQILKDLFKVFLNSSKDSYLQVYATRIYERMDHYIAIIMNTNNPNLIMDGYYSLQSFVNSLYYSDFVLQLFSIYSAKFLENAQQFVESRGKSGEKGFFEGICLALKAIVSKMNGKVNIDVYSQVVEAVINCLHVSLESFLIILLAQLVSCLGVASTEFAEIIIDIYKSSVDLNNTSIIVASCVLISVFFQEADDQNQYLRSIAVNIWDSLYSIFTNEDLGELTTSNANNILEGLSRLVSFIPSNVFAERCENFFNLLDSITKRIPKIKKIDFNDDYLETETQLFYGYTRVFEMYKDEEYYLIHSKETQDQSFLFVNIEKYLNLIKITEDNFDYRQTKKTDKMLMAFLTFLDQLILGIGRPINLQLNARWVKNLFDFAANCENTDVHHYANEIKGRYNSL